MSNITTVNPEDFLEGSKARQFMIVLTTPDMTCFYSPTDKFQNVDGGKMESPAINRRDLKTLYYEASSDAKLLFPAGRLDIVELPLFPFELS